MLVCDGVRASRATAAQEGGEGRSPRAAYLAGCDGGRSLIRKAARIALRGWEPTTSHPIAEVEPTEEPARSVRRDARGLHSLSRLEDGEAVRRCDML